MDGQQTHRKIPLHPELNSMGNASTVQDEQPIVGRQR
jgi:hypothetical protein